MAPYGGMAVSLAINASALLLGLSLLWQKMPIKNNKGGFNGWRSVSQPSKKEVQSSRDDR
ncbi:hypothetical protein N7468_010605 [Penicillium chermesinum]|uniref:Uncharacterized protein n=1 Tax=Penicillium chermesinum TaxID=63820 RepID=A0A9W9TA25_9EURO|nr:uncharacterized protein N7468_010605 [Penicillium chermesinum]KAJ5214926.1 hypothetical protein N7468_010605 [Penicillium chermesinum]